MGHRFVTSIGQRLIIDGFYGAMDFAFGGDGWFYVLNRYDTNPAYPKLRFAVCNLDDEFPRNIDPHINGESMQGLEDQWDSAVFCDSDKKGSIFFTDERKNQVHERFECTELGFRSHAQRVQHLDQESGQRRDKKIVGERLSPQQQHAT